MTSHRQPGTALSGKRRRTIQLLAAACMLMLTGCGLIATTGVVVVSAVGVAGYAVYSVGEAVITGIGSAAGATGRAIGTGSKAAATVVFRDGEFKAECPQDSLTVCKASNTALLKGGFQSITGKCDALSGELKARTCENADIVVRLKNVSPEKTEIRIRVGVKGDLKASESIYRMIVSEMNPPQEASHG